MERRCIRRSPAAPCAGSPELDRAVAEQPHAAQEHVEDQQRYREVEEGLPAVAVPLLVAKLTLTAPSAPVRVTMMVIVP